MIIGAKRTKTEGDPTAPSGATRGKLHQSVQCPSVALAKEGSHMSVDSAIKGMGNKSSDGCPLGIGRFSLYAESMQLALTAIGLFLAFVGIVGLVVPLLPDIPLISSGIVIVLIAHHAISIATVGPLLGLTVLAMLADWLLVLYGARKVGASREGTLGGLIGLALALLGLPIGFGLGLVLWPTVGAIIGELIHARQDPEPKKAARIGLSVGIFTVFSLVVKLILVGLILAIGIISIRSTL